VVLGASVVERGTELEISGSGFLPGERVEAVVRSDPVRIGQAVAGQDGRVAFLWTVPADLAVGGHRVELTGESSGLVWAAFVVSAGSETPPSGAAGGGSASPSGGGGLPVTGSDGTGGRVLGVFCLLLAGGFALRLRRRLSPEPAGGRRWGVGGG
jgi:hypothetical protein